MDCVVRVVMQLIIYVAPAYLYIEQNLLFIPMSYLYCLCITAVVDYMTFVQTDM